MNLVMLGRTDGHKCVMVEMSSQAPGYDPRPYIRVQYALIIFPAFEMCSSVASTGFLCWIGVVRVFSKPFFEINSQIHDSYPETNIH